MYYIPIIAGSTRRDRQSIKVARFVLARLRQRKEVETELLDLLEYNFPIMEERLHRRDDPPPRLQEFGDKIGRADSLIIVSPEYNNGYPGVLKNALDYLLPEYERKPVGIVTVSAGGHGGITCLAQLRSGDDWHGRLSDPGKPVGLPCARQFSGGRHAQRCRLRKTGGGISGRCPLVHRSHCHPESQEEIALSHAH